MPQAWFISGLIHVIVLSLLASSVAQRAQLAGAAGEIRLNLVMAERAAAPPAVVVMPEAARIAKRHFVYVPTAADRPSSDLFSESASPAPRLATPLPTRAQHSDEHSTMAGAMAASYPKQLREPSVQATVPAGTKTPPRFENNSPPTYPAAAVAARIEGTVLLRLRLASDGLVIAVRVAESSGHEILDAAAVNAVKRWRGEPARLDGIAVESTELLPVQFQLR